MENTNVFQKPVILLVACAVVGLLAAIDTFSSAEGFPLILGLVCLGVGLLSLRSQPRVALLRRLAVIVLGPALATAGFLVYGHNLEQRLAALQQEISAELAGTAAPRLTGMEPLNVEPSALEQAASYSNPATIVTFWARWCSPCWKELPELDELYRQHAGGGLAVVALTKYDEPDDEAACRSQLARDRDFVRDRGLTIPFAVTTEVKSVYDGFMVRSLPSSVLVDGAGRIVAYGVGLEGGREVMRRAVALIGEG